MKINWSVIFETVSFDTVAPQEAGISPVLNPQASDDQTTSSMPDRRR